MSTHIVGLSGGKDSTALALRLAETAPEVGWQYICTPTGDELPAMHAHWARLERLLGRPLIKLGPGSLDECIDQQGMLPNWRARFCTRILKIEPCQQYIDSLDGDVHLYIGLRADEEGREGGIYSGCSVHFPFRDWGWSIDDVWAYLDERGVEIPERTDCARCFFQTIAEWRELWLQHPDIYEAAVQQETRLGHTFRSPSRDTWPADLAGLRREFERGRIPRGAKVQHEMFGLRENQCRVCSL